MELKKFGFLLAIIMALIGLSTAGLVKMYETKCRKHDASEFDRKNKDREYGFHWSDRCDDCCKEESANIWEMDEEFWTSEGRCICKRLSTKRLRELGIETMGDIVYKFLFRWSCLSMKFERIEECDYISIDDPGSGSETMSDDPGPKDEIISANQSPGKEIISDNQSPREEIISGNQGPRPDVLISEQNKPNS